MKIGTSKHQRLAGGSGIMDHAMTLIQIVGIAVTVVVLKRFTPLPFWACCLVGLPLFLVIFLSSIYLLARRRR
jgi:hypothetical protein